MSVWYQMIKGHSENGKFFHGVKKLFKLSQTWHIVSPVNVKCNTKRIFAIACLGKSLYFIRKFANFANNEF